MSTVLASGYRRWPSNSQPIENGLESSWRQVWRGLQVPDDMAVEAVLKELVSACDAQDNASAWLDQLLLPWVQTANTDSITVDIESLLGRLQEQRVELIDTNAIREYMRDHSDMVSEVDIVAALVRSRFGKNAQLILDVYSDPESDDQYLQLRVRATDYNSEFMNLIDAVDTLAEPVLRRRTGRILLTTDFVPIH